MPKDNEQELFYLVDEEDIVLGSISREKAHSSPEFIHRSVQILLFNDRNQVLLQKRSLQKKLYPHAWTVSASGHVTFGDTYEATAQRELQEEIGVSTTLELKTKHISKHTKESEMLSIFTGMYNDTPTNLDPTEVEKVEWIDISNLKEFVANNEFTFTGKKALAELRLI